MSANPFPRPHDAAEAWRHAWEVDGRDLRPLLLEVGRELERASRKFGSFASAHEGYAVLLEEVDELWHEIKHGTPEAARAEAVQVAAMAVRLLLDSFRSGA